MGPRALRTSRRPIPRTPIAVFDCDLMAFGQDRRVRDGAPGAFVECGVGEHNAATAAASVSVNGVLSFWADFGVFGLDEAYNQQRLDDINDAALKLALTHCGLDVGEDGRTHQCIDYVGALRSMFGWRVIVPADANQTDRAVRAAATMPGCVAVAMGRSKLPQSSPRTAAPRSAATTSSPTARSTSGPATAATPRCSRWARSPERPWTRPTPARGGVLRLDVGRVPARSHLDDAVMERSRRRPLLVTVEDHSVRTGLGASVALWLASSGLSDASGAARRRRVRVLRDAGGPVRGGRPRP